MTEPRAERVSREVTRLRLDFMPHVTLDGPVDLGDFVALPFWTFADQLFPDARARRSAERLVRLYRQPDGKRVSDVTVFAKSGPRLLPETPAVTEQTRFLRAVEAFRYQALQANVHGFGANSTHLHLVGYTFLPGVGPLLTITSRYHRLMGLRSPQFRAPPHLSTVALQAASFVGQFGADLVSQIRDLRGKARPRLWRALWWFNQAHHDDPYQPAEFAMSALASAFEALVRPSAKVFDLQRAVQRATGTADFDTWVADFYAMRSQISHGDLTWEPLFGPYRHISHYEIATALFRLLVEERLGALVGTAGPSNELVQALRVGPLRRLLRSDREIIDRLVGLTFQQRRAEAPRT